MIAVLLPLLLLAPGIPGGAQQASTGRMLVLPDVTLSAEDPLYLAVPAPVGWTLGTPEQPALDRRRLWAVEVPPRVRFLEALPPLPESTPGPEYRGTGGGARVPLHPGGVEGNAPPNAAAGAGEFGLQALYRSNTTAGLDLWLDRRRSPWELAASSSLTLSGELPSSFELRTAAALQRPSWRGSLKAEGAGILRSPDSGFLAGALSVELRRDPAPFGLQSATRLDLEQPAEEGDSWLMFSQDLAGSWRGERWGLGAGGTAFALLGQATALRGLARLGLQWEAGALTVSAGGAVLASRNGSRLYPEGTLELRPLPSLRLLACLAAYLEPPAPFLVREVFGGAERAALLPPAGLGARLAALLESPGNGSFEVGLRAFDGERLLLRDGLLYLGTDPHLAAEVSARLALNPENRQGPSLILSAGGDGAIALPVTSQAFRQPLYGGLNAGLRLGFAKRPMELILQARWGELPPGELESSLAERRAAGYAGWQASLVLRWEARPPLAVEGGLEAGAKLGGLAGLSLQARRSL